MPRLAFLGYYVVREAGVKEPYLQLRYTLDVPVAADNLVLSVENESDDQDKNEAVRYAEAVDVDEAKKRIPWLGKSLELESYMSTRR